MADPNPKYNDQSTYNKFNADCGCDDKDSCSCSDDCNICCPIGTVAVVDDCGNTVGCLNPNDAEHYEASQIKCAEGFVKTLHPVTGEFLGCLHPTDAASLISLLDPSINPPVVPDSDKMSFLPYMYTDVNVVSSLLTPISPTFPTANNVVNLVPGSNTFTFYTNLERNNCHDEITMNIVSLTATSVTFNGGSTSAVIPVGVIQLFLQIEVDNAAPAGNYPFELNFTSANCDPVQVLIEYVKS